MFKLGLLNTLAMLYYLEQQTRCPGHDSFHERAIEDVSVDYTWVNRYHQHLTVSSFQLSV